MIREHLFDKRAPADPLFRWRGGQISRMEGLSDGVFGLTITLVVVSTGAPTTFHEMWLFMRDLPVLLASFSLLLMAWQYHYQFFRRYGLEDGMTAFLNAVFLFLILFYAYPLKFMATFLWRLVLGDDSALFAAPPGVESLIFGMGPRSGMMVFYGLGIVGVFGVLCLMCAHAYKLREQLELDEIERVLTVSSIRAHAITVAIATLSLAIVLSGGQPGWAGVVYFLMAPLHTANGFYGRLRAERLREALDASE